MLLKRPPLGGHDSRGFPDFGGHDPIVPDEPIVLDDPMVLDVAGV